MDNNYSECVNKCFGMYTLEKARNLLKRCNNKELNPLGTVTCFELIVYDVRKGVDGYDPNKKFQSAPITIFPSEVECFSKCFHNEEYASQVKEIYKKLYV